MTRQLYATNPIHHDTRRYWEKGIEMIRLQYRKIHKQTALRKKAATYFEKYPKNLEEAITIVVDPMLATGGSSVAAIDMVKKQGATNIKLVCLVGAPEGVKTVEEAHPDVDIYLASLDDHLNEHGYIVPGLGDAGDRIFGTK